MQITDLVINKTETVIRVERKVASTNNRWLFFEEIEDAIKSAGLPVKGWRQSKTVDAWIFDLIERPKHHPLTS